MTSILPALEGVAFGRCPDGRFEVLNGALPAWYGALRRAKLPVGVPFVVDEAFPFLSTFLPEAEEAWAAGPPARAESDLWTEVASDGGEIHLEATAVTVERTRVLVIMRSDRLFMKGETLLQRARELRFTHASLMKEIQQKDILVHAIVHDLAAPLHSIIGVLSLLRERTLEAESSQWIRLAMQAAVRQRDLIAEILDVFAAGDDALGVRMTEPVDLAAVLDEVVAEREPVAKNRDIRLSARHPRATQVLADKTRLFRVLTNLVDNAVRHSPSAGEITMTVKTDETTATVLVDDDGPGVQTALLPRLFEKFARGADRNAGTGLGLYYCRITVESWGGGIGYETRDEGGARFWIRLRRALSAENKEDADGQAAFAGR